LQPVFSPRNAFLLLLALLAFLYASNGVWALTRPYTPTLRQLNPQVAPEQETVGAVLTPQPHGSFRIMTYNIHHAAGIDGVVDLQRIADVISAAQPDVVLLNEVDSHWRRSGFTDQGRMLAELLSMPYAVAADTVLRRNPYDAGLFGVARYGLALLSKFPLSRVEVVPIQSKPGQEPRAAIVAEIRLTDDEHVRIIGTHLGLDQTTRLENVELFLTLLQEWEGPSILLGDMNALPQSPELARLTGMQLLPHLAVDESEVSPDGTANVLPYRTWVDTADHTAPPTFPSSDPKSRIDFILVTEDLAERVVNYVTPYSPASDHLPVWVELAF
jgi:endonuclease/exonuclease/phosphatase family metal-dependent hydrolase